MKKMSKFLILLIIIISIFFLLTIFIVTNINLSNALLGWSEYQAVEFRDKLIYFLSLGWWFILFIIIIFGFIISVKNFKKRWFIGILIIIISTGIWYLIGVSTSISTIDQNIFRKKMSSYSAMTSLLKKKDLRQKDIQLISYSLHFRNPVLQTGVYAVSRIINPVTELQDEYWYYPTNPFLKWSKTSNNITLPVDETISYNKIPWDLIPKMLSESKQRVNKLPVYYRGISILILSESGGRWYWTLSAEDIRGHNTYSDIYSLEGKYIETNTASSNSNSK